MILQLFRFNSLRIISAFIWTAFIVYALTKEPSGIPKLRLFGFHGADKLVHIILFGIEAFLVSYSLMRLPKIRLFIYVLLWSFILGGGLELVQHHYISGRLGDLMDLLADMVGAILGVVGFWMVGRKQ